MIKENDLVPGKVITSVETRATRTGLLTVVTAWLVIGFQGQVKRRHGKARAPKQGWHVLLLRFGSGDRVLHDVVITPDDMRTNRWKRLF